MAKASKALYFTRLKLVNWKNFREVDIRLHRRAFFVGPNASGKSNLIDAIRFVAEIARRGSGLAGGGLQSAIAERGDFSQLRCLNARAIAHVAIEFSAGSEDEPDLWQYALRLDPVGSSKTRRTNVTSESVRHRGEPVAEWGRADDSDPIVFSQTLLEDAQRNQAFRPLVEFLASCRYLHVVPQIVRDRERAKADGEDPYGGDLLRRIKAMPKKSREPRLARISEALKIAVPQFTELNLVDDENGVPHLEARYAGWRRNEHRQRENLFSDGTLRLIGLLWSIAEKGGPLLLEEPELSLNDAVIAELPRMFRSLQKLTGRQVIATTHSPTVLDGGLGLNEVHLISVDTKGSHVKTLGEDLTVKAQVDGGMHLSEVILPLLRPAGVEKLGRLDVAH